MKYHYFCIYIYIQMYNNIIHRFGVTLPIGLSCKRLHEPPEDRDNVTFGGPFRGRYSLNIIHHIIKSMIALWLLVKSSSFIVNFPHIPSIPPDLPYFAGYICILLWSISIIAYQNQLFQSQCDHQKFHGFSIMLNTTCLLDKFTWCPHFHLGKL